jgi:hypothetical protein
MYHLDLLCIDILCRVIFCVGAPPSLLFLPYDYEQNVLKEFSMAVSLPYQVFLGVWRNQTLPRCT